MRVLCIRVFCVPIPFVGTGARFLHPGVLHRDSYVTSLAKARAGWEALSKRVWRKLAGAGLKLGPADFEPGKLLSIALCVGYKDSFRVTPCV